MADLDNLPVLRRIDQDDEETSLLAADKAKGAVDHDGSRGFSMRRRGGSLRLTIQIVATVVTAACFVVFVVLWQRRAYGITSPTDDDDGGGGSSYFTVTNYYIDRDGPAGTKYATTRKRSAVSRQRSMRRCVRCAWCGCAI